MKALISVTLILVSLTLNAQDEYYDEVEYIEEYDQFKDSFEGPPIIEERQEQAEEYTEGEYMEQTLPPEYPQTYEEGYPLEEEYDRYGY